MSVSALPGRWCVSIRSLTKIWLVLLLMLSANGCTIAREALYAPRESPIDIREWTNTPPEEIKVVTSDGLTLTGYYWPGDPDDRSEEHTSELQSLMRISYAVFCLKKKKT